MPYILLLTAVFFTGCKPLIEPEPRIAGADFACVNQYLLSTVEAAEKRGDKKAMNNLVNTGCIVTRRDIEIKPLYYEGDQIYVEILDLGFMRMAPGMEKIKSLKLWTTISNVKNVNFN